MSTQINDFKNNLYDDAAGDTIRPQTATADVNGQAVDLVDTDGPCGAKLVVGAVSGTTTLNVKMQESTASGGTYTDITGATFTAVTASNKSQIINFKRTKRFVRAAATLTGSTTSAAIAVIVLAQKKNI